MPVENEGLRTLVGLTASLIDGNGETVAAKTLDGTLESGAQMTIDEVFTLDTSNVPSNLSLVITSSDGTSSDAYELPTSESCIELATTTIRNDDGSLTVNAQIGNKSAIATSAIFHVYKGSGDSKVQLASSDAINVAGAGLSETALAITAESLVSDDEYAVLTYTVEVDGSESSYLSDDTFVYKAQASGVRGDANGNGVVNIMDAQIVFDMANNAWTQTTAYDKLLAALTNDWNLATLEAVTNVNGGTAIDSSDARAIQYHVHNGSFDIAA